MIELYSIIKISTGEYLGCNIIDDRKIYTFDNPDVIEVFTSFAALSHGTAIAGVNPSDLKIVRLVPQDV